jgi:hypothetical protein
MQSHIHTLVKHLFNKDSFDQVTVQELKQFTEAYPYAAAGQFLYAKKLYDARSWNYYEQTEQASLYFHNPLWYSWLMEQKYDASAVAPVQPKQEEVLQQQSAYRVVVQMPKGEAPLTVSPPASENELSRLHEFDAQPDAAPIEASTESFGDIQAPAPSYTEAVTDNTGEEPQPLTQEDTTSGLETIADITAAKEEIETTPEFFAEASQPVDEGISNTVAVSENGQAENQTIEENDVGERGLSSPIGFEVAEPAGNEEPVAGMEGGVVAFAESIIGKENAGVVQEENIPAELMSDLPDLDGVHAASDLTPSGIPDHTTTEAVSSIPLQEDLTVEHTLDEPVAAAPPQQEPVEPEKTTEKSAETSPPQQTEPVTAVDPPPIAEIPEASTEEPAVQPIEQEPAREEQPEAQPIKQEPVTEEQSEKITEQPAETSPTQASDPVTAVEPQPVTEEPAEWLPEQTEAPPAEQEPVTKEQPPIVEEPAGPAADVEPELQAQPEAVAAVEEPQPIAETQETQPVAEEEVQQPVAEEPQPATEQHATEAEESIALPGLADLPPVSAFTPASTEPKATIDTEEPIFESYHTIDYFASQGIKLQQEDYNKDRLGKQLKTFSEWLRSMKRLVPVTEATASLDDVTNQSIQRIAEHSVQEKEVITEAMAEVWAKQGHIDKAISVYQKLSLLNPAKSTYFASRIEQLKAL